jgi:hypothetical protein
LGRIVKLCGMEGLTSPEVLAVAKAVDDAWLPDGPGVVDGDDYLVVCRPAHLSSSSFGRVQAWISSNRPFSEIRPEVEALALEWGVHEVWWWTESDVRPAVDEALRLSGAELALTQLLMARPLAGHDTDAWLATGDRPGVGEAVVADETSFEALNRVEAAGWGRMPPPPEVLVDDWQQLKADLRSSSAFALLGTMDGTPAAVGRCRLFDSVVRLFGAVTLPAFRGNGLYNSVLRARCRLGRTHGATMALTKGRPATSAPILQRAGFRTHQTERCWRLPVRPAGAN